MSVKKLLVAVIALLILPGSAWAFTHGLAASSNSYEGLVASRARMMGPTSSAGNHQIMMRSAHFATENLTTIRIVFSNFYNANRNGGTPIPDSGRGAATSITASVEYPAGTFTQIKFSGSATGSIPDASVLFSDFFTVSIPSGAQFWVRLFTTNSAGIIFNNWQNSFLGEQIEIAASGLTDKTMGGTVTNTGAAWSTPPLAILGMTVNPSVIIVGDSIAAGQADTEDSSASVNGFNGKVGTIARSLGNVPFLNLAVSGEQAETWIADSTARDSVIQKGSQLVVALGTNDIHAPNSRTAAQVVADLGTVGALKWSSQKLFYASLLPRSTSTDSWATTTNQTTVDNSVRTTLNNTIRGVLAGSNGTFDLASVFETSQNSGIWLASPTPPYTGDGVHPTPSGYLLVPPTNIVLTPTWP